MEELEDYILKKGQLWVEGEVMGLQAGHTECCEHPISILLRFVCVPQSCIISGSGTHKRDWEQNPLIIN